MLQEAMSARRDNVQGRHHRSGNVVVPDGTSSLADINSIKTAQA